MKLVLTDKVTGATYEFRFIKRIATSDNGLIMVTQKLLDGDDTWTVDPVWCNVEVIAE